MATCEVCGNHYDQSFELRLGGEAQVFDSFECAFYAVAPTCACCDNRIAEHGIEVAGLFFCCAHCMQHYGLVPEFNLRLSRTGEKVSMEVRNILDSSQL